MKKHYVYKITRKSDDIKYIGVRSCLGNPEDDLGYVYFSSSRDKDFMNEQKENPNNFIYEIITESPDRKTANEFEVMLHRILDVANSPEYLNKARATSSGFCFEGVKHSRESKDKMSRVQMGKKHTKEHRENNSKARIGEKHHLWGTKRSQEIRDKISKAHQGKTLSQKHKDKIGKSKKNTVSCRDLRTGEHKRVTKEEFRNDDLLVGSNSNKPNIKEK